MFTKEVFVCLAVDRRTVSVLVWLTMLLECTLVIVQKFGGTSLGTSERMLKVANIVKKFNNENNAAVAVVSALSSETKAEGTTSRLLGAAEAAVSKKEFHPFLDRIEDTHMEVIYGNHSTLSPQLSSFRI